MRKRRNFTPEFKTQVVLELLREEKDLAALASEHDIAPNMLCNWKKEFLANASSTFSNKKEVAFEEEKIAYENKIVQLYNTIGQLTVDVNWIKKIKWVTLKKSLNQVLTIPNMAKSIEVCEGIIYNTGWHNEWHQ